MFFLILQKINDFSILQKINDFLILQKINVFLILQNIKIFFLLELELNCKGIFSEKTLSSNLFSGICEIIKDGWS